MRNIQIHTVKANGAINAFLALKLSRTELSMNSMISSTKLINPFGESELLFKAANLKRVQNKIPKPIDQAIESTCMAQKPMAATSPAPCAKVQVLSLKISRPCSNSLS